MIQAHETKRQTELFTEGCSRQFLKTSSLSMIDFEILLALIICRGETEPSLCLVKESNGIPLHNIEGSNECTGSTNSSIKVTLSGDLIVV